MKNILLVILLWISALNVSGALPPTRAGGTDQILKAFFNLKTYGSGVTDLGGPTKLLEGKAEPLLPNPSFETIVPETSWTSVAGTLSAELVTKIEGAQSLEIALAAQTLDLSQVISIDQYDQKYVEFSCEINSTEDLEVCAMDDAVELQCIPALGNDKWTRYGARMQVISGNSYGIKIKSSGNITDSVFVDKCEFTSDYKQFVVDQEENNFSAKLDNNGSTCTVLQENFPFVASCARGSLGLLTGTFVVDFFGVTPNMTAMSEGAANLTTACVVTGTTTFSCETNSTAGAKQDTDVYIAVQRQGSDYRAPKTFSSTPASSNLTDWEQCVPTASVGFGTLTVAEGQCKRVGDSLEVRGTFVNGSAAASVAYLIIPTFQGKTITIDDTKAMGAFNNTHGDYQRLAGVASLLSNGWRGALQYNGTNADRLELHHNSDVSDNYSPTNNVNSIFGASERIVFHYTVPIAEWTSTNVMLSNTPIPLVMNVHVSATGRDSITDSTAYKTRNITSLSGDTFGVLGIDAFTVPVGHYSVNIPVGARGDCDGMDSQLFDNTDSVTFGVKRGANSTGSQEVIAMYLLKFEVTQATEIEFQTKISNLSCASELVLDWTITKYR